MVGERTLDRVVSRLGRLMRRRPRPSLAVLGALFLLAAAAIACRGGSGPSTGSSYVEPASEGTESSPILVLVDDAAANPFGRYLGEILRAEGINGFRVARWSEVPSLDEFDTVLLAEQAVDGARAERLRAFVSGGGLLIGMRPAARLAGLFGVTRIEGSVAEGSIQVDDSTASGRGIDAGPLRFHGVADHYRATAAGTIAWLVEQCGAAQRLPAITLHHHGRGRAVLWAYDLARSVAYARQGNPAWADQERDGLEGIRAADMYVGWIDLDRLRVAQADEQQRLLANLASAPRPDTRPVPRLWYFPAGADSVLVATGDAHATPAYAIADVLGRVERHGGRMTIYYEPPRSAFWRQLIRRARWRIADLPVVGPYLANPTGFPSPSQVAAWRSHGHEFALHPAGRGGSRLSGEWRRFTSRGYAPVSPTVRTHQVLWQGWVDTAREQAEIGFRMNLDSYQVGPAFRRAGGDWPAGFFTGSGLPMRFVDEKGRILKIYQQASQLVDEHWMDLGWKGQANLSPEEAITASRLLLQDAVTTAPAAIAAQFHVDPFVHEGEHRRRAAAWLEGTLDSAVELGIPILSAAEWLHFVEVRNDTHFRELTWDNSTDRLSFRIESLRAPGIELTLMVPSRHHHTRLARVEVDGVEATPGRRELGAVGYQTVAVDSGMHGIVAVYSGR